MLRSPLKLSALLLLVGACSVGEVSDGSGGDGGGSGSGNRAVCVDRVAGPPGAYQHTTAPTGDRAGMGCIAVGCHLTGSVGAGAGPMAFAGTAYTAITGGTPAAGATVRVFSVGGTTPVATAITDTAGNFIIRGNFTAFPYETDITACGSTPDIKAMLGQIVTGTGPNCNGGGTCHVQPGTNAVYIP